MSLDRLDYCSCLEKLDEIKYYKSHKIVRGNICSSESVSYVLEEEEIDTVMHFAAQIQFGNSFSFTQSNILRTLMLLESAKVHGIKRFIHVSTDEVYGEGTEDQGAILGDQELEVRRKRDTGRQKEGEILKDVHILSGCQFIGGSFGHVTFRDVRSNLSRLISLLFPPLHSLAASVAKREAAEQRDRRR